MATLINNTKRNVTTVELLRHALGQVKRAAGVIRTVAQPLVIEDDDPPPCAERTIESMIAEQRKKYGEPMADLRQMLCGRMEERGIR